ncbi:MAG: hypothetical protein GYB68_01540, partial [Chloroflexi bacterium]|nr:hypothetical protein [Chloroflexota bacterium]
TWIQSDIEDVEVYVNGGSPYLSLIQETAFANIAEAEATGRYFYHTFYIAQPLPNLVFHGGQPVELNIAADEVVVDSSGGLRVGESFTAGSIYSVGSVAQNFSPEQLRETSTAYPPEILEKYLQLPDTVSQRTNDLAERLTEDALTPYDKVVAIRDYLLVTYPYDFYPPPQPRNTDAVDQFLFVDQTGVCEHYVSAMVIMLRSQGIPARFVVGYGAGDYNSITNYYEVRANDAHAWTEVYFPELGWVPFDPTPGWEGFPQTGPIRRWAFSGWGGLDLPSISLGPVIEVGASAFSIALTPLLILVGTAMIITSSVLLFRASRAWLAQWQSRAFYRDPARRKVFRAYRRAQRRSKRFRQPAETVREHSRHHSEIKALADAVEIAAYRAEPPSPDILER